MSGPGCWLIWNRGAPENIAAISVIAEASDCQTFSCSAMLNCTGTRTAGAIAGKSWRAQFDTIWSS